MPQHRHSTTPPKEAKLFRNNRSQAVRIPVEFELPGDKDVPSSVNRGVPLALANPRSGLVKSIGEIADKLVPQRAAADAKKKKRRGVR